MIAPPQLELPNKFAGFDGRVLNEADVPALIELRNTVLSQLRDPDLYVREADEAAFMRALCGPAGQTYGVFDGERVIAYGAIGFPAAAAEDNLGKVMGYAPEVCAQVAHVASCMVLPAYRGHGLQRLLLRARFALALASGRRYAVAMVSLKNFESRHNMLRQGMQVRWVGEVDGLQRQLLVRDLLIEAQPATMTRWLDAADWEQQCALSARGWWGWREQAQAQGGQLEFAPPRVLSPRPQLRTA